MISDYELIAFDADDTLWLNQPLYTNAGKTLEMILQDHVDSRVLHQRLNETEIKNLKIFGYGIKGFTLSMIETALELTQGAVTSQQIQEIIDLGKTLLQHPVELLPGVREVVTTLHGLTKMIIITKGDLFDQESKIARSGLADYFDDFEIVSEKDVPTYTRILAKHQVAPASFLMIGNSPRSDILPVCAMGGHAILIPYESIWGHEAADESEIEASGCVRLSAMTALLDHLPSK